MNQTSDIKTEDGLELSTNCRQLKMKSPDGKMVLNDAGMMIQTVWNEIPSHYPGIETDAFVVTPNHVHGLIIVGADPRACPHPANRKTGQPQGTGQPVGVSPRGYPKPRPMINDNHEPGNRKLGNHRGLPLRYRILFIVSKQLKLRGHPT